MKPIQRTRTPEEVISLFESRYTSKSYDPERKVSAEDLNAILEAGRLSPSSMGMEPWHFIVTEAGELTEELQQHCWGVRPTPSHWVFLLGRNPEAFVPDGDERHPYIGHIHTDVQKHVDISEDVRYDKVRSFLTEDLGLTSRELQRGWVDRQVYLAMESMLLAAAMLGVDSTPVEGLNPAAVQQVLVERGLFDPKEFHFISLITFGYTNREEHRPKTRRPREEVVTAVGNVQVEGAHRL